MNRDTVGAATSLHSAIPTFPLWNIWADSLPSADLQGADQLLWLGVHQGCGRVRNPQQRRRHQGAGRFPQDGTLATEGLISGRGMGGCSWKYETSLCSPSALLALHLQLDCCGKGDDTALFTQVVGTLCPQKKKEDFLKSQVWTGCHHFLIPYLFINIRDITVDNSLINSFSILTYTSTSGNTNFDTFSQMPQITANLQCG